MSQFDIQTDQRTGATCLTANFNGLKIIVVPKHGFVQQYAVYATHYGSVNNCFRFNGKTTCVPNGIAHFLEHKMFEKPYGDAFTKYAQTGANANAFTSFEQTSYLFSCTENFYDSLAILTEVVNQPYFTEESVAKEQGIIGQEIQMGLDNPGSVVFYNLLKSLFIKHPIRDEIAGSIESISKITPELLYECYNAFYNPANMVLCVCGDIDPDKVVDIVSSGLRDVKSEKVECLFEDEPERISSAYTETKAEISRPIFEFGIKDSFHAKGIELVKHRIASDIILDSLLGNSSKLYLELYNEGLINQTFSSEVMIYPDCGLFAVGGESSDPMKVYSRIVDALNKLNSEGLDQITFDKLIRKNYGYMLNDFDNVGDLADGFVDAYFDGISFLDELDIYRNLSLQDVNETLQYFDLEKMAASVILPKDGGNL